MMTRWIIPIIACFLFLIEPEFALFSPIHLGDKVLTFVPRFLIIFLIFITVFYLPKRAILYAFIFGILYDVFYIDIIGLYTVLYPLLCYLASISVKYIHRNLVVATILSVLLIAIMEFIMYEFYFLIQLTTMPLGDFLLGRLVPTIIANLLFIFMLGWAFKYIIDKRAIQRAISHS